MKIHIGDSVYFYQCSTINYEWKLYNYQKVIVKNLAFDVSGDMFYYIKPSDIDISKWYHEDDLLSEKEVRKYKIAKINEKTTY